MTTTATLETHGGDTVEVEIDLDDPDDIIDVAVATVTAATDSSRELVESLPMENLLKLYSAVVAEMDS